MRHLFVTADYPPDLGGMARRHVELCRRLPDTIVSTVAAPDAASFDAHESYRIVRQPFTFRGARSALNRWRWGRSLGALAANVDVMHCGNLRPCGTPVLAARRRTRPATPFLLYVYGGDLLREQAKIAHSAVKRWVTRRLFQRAAGVVTISRWSADLTRQLCESLGVVPGNRIAAIDLGTDPGQFRPENDRGRLRRRLGWEGMQVLLTVARLVPHKGQDVALRAVAALAPRYEHLRYLIVGEGPHGAVLQQLAHSLGIAQRVVFAGALPDDEVAEAYAMADIYVGLSRREGLDVEGFGISFVEAAASALAVIAGDSGGVRSAVREGETALVVPPGDEAAVAAAIAALLDDPERRRRMGYAGRRAVETHYNWERVARETESFTARAVGTAREPGA